MPHKLRNFPHHIFPAFAQGPPVFCARPACRPCRQGKTSPIFVSARGARRTRICSQARTNLGADTNESGSRHERIWDEIRVCTGRHSPTGIGEELATRRNGGVPPAISKPFSQQTFFSNDTTRTNQRNKKEPARRHERPREPVDARKRTGL